MGEFYYRKGTLRALHGTNTAYGYGCRCEKCKNAASAYRKKNRRNEPYLTHDDMQMLRYRRLVDAASPCVVTIHGIGKVELGDDYVRISRKHAGEAQRREEADE